MAAFARVRMVMLSGVACSILAACGADGVASPGEGVIVIPAPTPAPTPSFDAEAYFADRTITAKPDVFENFSMSATRFLELLTCPLITLTGI